MYITRSPSRCIACKNPLGRPHNLTCQFTAFSAHKVDRAIIASQGSAIS
jgi:hypothetical protein